MGRRQTDYYRVRWNDFLREKDATPGGRAAWRQCVVIMVRQPGCVPVVSFSPAYGYLVEEP